MSTESAEQRARAFLERAEEFMLGDLPTEQQHPRTTELSEWAERNLPRAFETIREIDLQVIHTAADKAGEIERLSRAIGETLSGGSRIFISGCGATGRLALTLEFLWREIIQHTERDSVGNSPGRSDRTGGKERTARGDAAAGDAAAVDGGAAGDANTLRAADAVVGFMAGGDLALVKSIEDFEDHPEYGARQLRELGFTDGDLLLAVTEGGETPFVIGTAEEAAQISRRPPWFLYCNPDDVLRNTVERSRRIIDSDRIIKLNLTTGPQVLSGSTRMQASTIQMYAIGLALLPHAQPAYADGEGSSAKDSATEPHSQPPGAVSDRREPTEQEIRERAEAFASHLASLDLNGLEKLTEREAEIYRAEELVTYETSEFGMCVVTDTTERAPTFSLAPFENFDDPEPSPAWAYLSVPGTKTAKEAWHALLARKPRALEWEGIEYVAGLRRLLGYDFSGQVPQRRAAYGRNQHTFRVEREDGAIRLTLDELSYDIDVSGLSLLEQFTLLKIVLNSHSTLLMGRLGRYESNVMLWVRPSNFKLIDRTTRYILSLLRRDGVGDVDYEAVVYEIFRHMERLDPNQSIVWHVYKAFTSTKR